MTALTADNLAAALLEVRQDFVRAGDGDAERAVRMTVAASEVLAVADVLAEPGLDTQGRQQALGERSQDAAAGAIKLARGDLGCATWQLSPPPDGVERSTRRSDGSDNSLLDSLPGINSALRTASEVERYLQGGGTAPDASADDGRLLGEFATGTTQLTPNAAANAAATKAIAAALALAPHPTDNLVASLTSLRQVSAAARDTLLEAVGKGAPPHLPATQTDAARALSGSGGSGAPPVPPPPHSGGHVSESPPLAAALGLPPNGPAPSPWSSRITPGSGLRDMHPGGVGGDHHFPVLSLSAFPAPSPMQLQLASLQLQQLQLLQHQHQQQQRQLSQEQQGWHVRSAGQPLAGDSLHLRLSPDPESLPPQPPSQHPDAVPLMAPPHSASQGRRGATAAGSGTRAARAAAAAARGLAAGSTGDDGGTAEPVRVQTGPVQRALAIVSPRRGGGGMGAAAVEEEYNVVPATFPSPLALAMDNTQGTQGPADQQQQPASVQLQPHGAFAAMQSNPLAALFGTAVVPASAGLTHQQDGQLHQQLVLQHVQQMQHQPPPPLPSHDTGLDGSVPRGTVLLPALNDPGRLSSPPLTSPPEDELAFTGGDAPSGWGTAEVELSARPAAWKALSRMGQAQAGQPRRMGAPPAGEASQQAGAVAAAARARARVAAPSRGPGAPVTRAERLNVPASRLFHDDGGGGGALGLGSSDPFAFPESQHEVVRPSRQGGAAAKPAGDGWRASKQALTKQAAALGPAQHPHGAGFAAFSPPWGAPPRGGQHQPAAPAARDAGLAAAALDSDDDDALPRGGAARPAGNPRRRQPAAAAAVSPSSGLVVVPRRGGAAKRRQPLVVDDSSESDEAEKEGGDGRRGNALDALAKVARGRAKARGKGGDGDADPDDETYVPSAQAGKAGNARGARNARGKAKQAAAAPERRSERKRKPTKLDEAFEGGDDDEEGSEEEEKPVKRTRGDAAQVPGRLFDGIRFLTTGYAAGSSAPRTELEKLLREHGGTLLSDVPPPGAGSGDDKWCIVVASSFVRTPKLLYALAANVPLVKPGWVQACVAAGRMLAPPHPKSSKAGEYEEHAFTEAPPLLPRHSPCMGGAVIVLAGAQAWTPSLGLVLRYAGAQVTEVDTAQNSSGAATAPLGPATDASRRASVSYDTPGLIPRGAVVVSQTEKPPRRLAAAVAGVPGCVIVRTEWAVQCLLQRKIVDTATYAAVPVTPGVDVKPNLGDGAAMPAVPARERQPRGQQPADEEDDAQLPPVPPQAAHPAAPSARPAEAAASRRDSGAHGVLGTPDSSVRGAAGVGKVPPPAAVRDVPGRPGAKAPGAAKRPRCLQPVPQNDLFEVEADCACSTAFKKVKVHCGCSSCGMPLCMSGKSHCFARHLRGEL